MTTSNATNTPRLSTDGAIMIGYTGYPPVAGSLTQPAAGLTITSGPGTITFALANDLAAVEGIATTGIAARTAASTWTTRTITAGSSKVSIADGDGVSGNPTIDVVEANVDINSLSGTLNVNKGGTGTTSLTDGGIILGSGTGAVTVTSQPSNGQLLIGATGGDPQLNSLTAPASGISITGGSGSITFALTDDLAALEALASTGIAVRSGASTWVQRTIVGGSSKITLTNGDGVAGNPSVDADESAFTLDNIGGTLSVSKGGTSANSLTDHGVLVGSGTGAITPLSVGANGQVLIGSTGADPVFNSLTQPASGLTITGGVGSVTFALADDLAALEALGSTGIAVRSGVNTWVQRTVVAGSASITVTNGDGVSGNISIDTTISGLTWGVETGTSASLVNNTGTISENAGLCTFTLPVTAAVGTEIRVVGKGSGMWAIAQNASQSISFVTQAATTTVGVTGSVAATAQFDGIHIVCVTANTLWVVIGSTGNLTIV